MRIYKQIVDNRNEIVVYNNKGKFIIGWFGTDLYWIMPEYISSNCFTIKKDVPYLFEFFEKLFSTHHFKNNTFIWLCEAGLPENSSTLKITKGKSFYRIRFIQNPKDIIAHARNICSICFCLSGSKNQEIANEFSILLHELLSRDYD